jgi:Flp pilus assembly pilin Flp
MVLLSDRGERSGDRDMLNSSKSILRASARLLTRFSRDERGQSTTEYILMLAVVVMIAMKFKSVFLGKITGIVDNLGTKIDGVVSDTQ